MRKLDNTLKKGFGNSPMSVIANENKREIIKKMGMKIVSFARVSTREQAEEGYSLPAQEKLLNEYTSRHNDWVNVKHFAVPESASGKQERKVFNLLLDYLDAHKDIKILLCEKVDRISRNFKDAVRLDEWLNENEERQIHFVKQNLVIHQNSRSHEKFQWDMYIALARQYSNNLSEETKKGLYEKAEQGWFPGNHKRGYKCIGDRGHKIWEVDEKIPDAKYIEMGFVLFNTGNHTLRTLAIELFKQGWSVKNKPISISELHKLLTDPFYCGEFIFKGKHYKNAKHKGLISTELFYSVQERLQRKVKAGKYRKHHFLFGGGLAICGECGRSFTWELQKGHHYGHCTKYKTSCSQRAYTKEDDVQNQVLTYIDKLKINDPEILEWVRKALKEAHKAGSEYHEDIIKELDAQYLRVKNRLDVLYDDRADGLITKDQYEYKKTQYEKQLNDIVEAKQKHCKANIDYMRLGINIFELAQKGREIYEDKLLMEEKKELLNFVFLNLKIKDKLLTPSFKNGFEVIAKRAEDGNWLPDMDSNHGKQIQSLLSYL